MTDLHIENKTVKTIFYIFICLVKKILHNGNDTKGLKHWYAPTKQHSILLHKTMMKLK